MILHPASSPNLSALCFGGSVRTQVANTRPSTLFYPGRHLVSTRWQCRALAQLLRSSYIYTVLKLHSALWRQSRGWCSSWWKWVWHPALRFSVYKIMSFTNVLNFFLFNIYLLYHNYSGWRLEPPSSTMLGRCGESALSCSWSYGEHFRSFIMKYVASCELFTDALYQVFFYS